ncbi:MAG: glycoside hydrolase family 3 C-terminal domain-containing protein [Bacilli bacterium]|nr:glycoside hydrolase family 3 C-terminal domain-containing protein [Bacilli bacterium]
MRKRLLIPLFLAGMAAAALASENQSIGVDAKFIGEFGERNAYIEHANKINNQLAEEGFVLLKNDGTFPIGKNSKITLVGNACVNFSKGAYLGDISYLRKHIDEIDFPTSLTNAGFQVNQTSLNFYKRSRNGRTNGNDGWKGNCEVTIGEDPIEDVLADNELINSFKEYNDLAIQVITRDGSEGCDVLTIDATDNVKFGESNKHALELSDNEQALFDELHNHFNKILILINSSNIFECDKFMNDPHVAGILWVDHIGYNCNKVITDILCGNVNPSGRTVDTWTRDFTKDPSFQNFSDNRHNTGVTIPNRNGKQYHQSADTMFNADGTPMRDYGADKTYTNTSNPNYLEDPQYKVVKGGLNGVKPASFVSYEEGIYNDYRYYETRYADMAKVNKENADTWYNGDSGVVFPFGYGLSYTTFKQEIVRVNPLAETVLDRNSDLIEVSVKVTNTGNVAGKDAVQLYWKAPYTAGGIEKADHVLCAFDKTGTIEPGKSQTVHLTFHLQDVADYDYKDANNNGHVGYELDEGNYAIMCMKNAHESYGEVALKVKNGGITYDKDRYTGNKVINRFTNRGFFSSMPGEKDIEFTEMSRSNFETTFPHYPSFEDRKVKECSRYEEILTTPFDLVSFEEGKNYDFLPSEVHKSEQDGANWVQKGEHTIQLKEMASLDIDDPKWEEFINEFSWTELMRFVEEHRMSSPSMESIGKESSSEGDGAQKFSIMPWVCPPIVAATFNPRLAHEQGECIGMESQISGKDGWWGPNLNLRRSPFGGRNLYFYSADPFLTGRIASQVVKAATDRGVYAYVRNFALAEQEKNREGLSTFVNEQALRELYLKPFQMVVEEGKTVGIMTAYNRIGNMEAAANYPLLTEVLREEWGFDGSLLSDMIHTGNSSYNHKCYEDITFRVMAGCNCQQDSNGFKDATKEYVVWVEDVNNGKDAPVCVGKENQIAWSFWYACRKAVKEHLHMIVNSTAMQRGLTQVVGKTNLDVLINEDVSLNVADDLINKSDIKDEIVNVFDSSNNKTQKILKSVDSYEINNRCTLPEGVSLNRETGVISGKFTYSQLARIDVIANLTFTDGTSGCVAYQYVIDVVPYRDIDIVEGIIDDPIIEEPNNNNNNEIVVEKGCNGSIGATSIFVSSLALVGMLLMVLSRKKFKKK